MNLFIYAFKSIGENSIHKIRYSTDGVLINQVIDTIDNNNKLIRNSNEKQIIFKGNKVVSVKDNIKLKSIHKPKSEVLFVENQNIGVIDLETYLAKDGIYKVYALGFKTNLAKDSQIYYIDENDLNHNKIILDMVN